MSEQLPDGSQVFRASWRGWTAALTLVVALFAGLLAWGAFTVEGQGGVLGVLAVLFAVAAGLLLRQHTIDIPLLQVGPEGISGQFTRGHTVPWSEVVEADHQTVQGQEMISLLLREGSPWLAPTKPLIGARRRRGTSLMPLRKADRARAVAAFLQAFHQHADAQAEQAAQAWLDDAWAHGEFEQRLREKTPSLWALYAVVALNVGVWLLNLLDGMSPLQPITADLFRWGASSASAVVRDGEWWRLVTATVLHGGLVHLALNMWALWVAGTQVTRWFGNGQFLLIYWGSALAGSALSLHFSAQQAVSVGASGAVFGVLGALLAGVVQHRDRVPKAVVTQLLTSQGAFVAISLVQGFTRPGIDNAAHIGGLLAGAGMAWLLVEVVDETASAAHRRGRQWLAAAAAGLVVAGLVWAAPAGVDHRALLAEQTALREVLPAFQKAEQALQADAKAEQEGRISPQQLVEALEQRHMPAYRAVGEALARVPADVRSDRLDDLRGLQSGMLELMALEVGQARGTLDPAQAQARVAQVTQALRTISERMKARNTGG